MVKKNTNAATKTTKKTTKKEPECVIPITKNVQVEIISALPDQPEITLQQLEQTTILESKLIIDDVATDVVDVASDGDEIVIDDIVDGASDGDGGDGDGDTMVLDLQQGDNIDTSDTAERELTRSPVDDQPKKRGRKSKKGSKDCVSTKFDAKSVFISELESTDNNDLDSVLKTKRRGRKPKDKFKYESADFDEYQRNNKKEDNIVIKLPLTCIKLNEEFNLSGDMFPYNPTLTIPKPYIPEHHISYSSLTDEYDRESSEDSNIYINESKVQLNPDNFDPNNFNKCFEAIKHDKFGDKLDKENEYRNNMNSGATNNNTNNIGNNLYDTNVISGTDNFCNKCTHCTTLKTYAETGNTSYTPESDIRQIDLILNNKYNSNTDKFNVLTNMSSNGTTSNKWHDQSDVACLWCCHTFETTPWGIPYKYSLGRFTLFGNFCASNCALAYLLTNYKDDDTIWEKVALLNLLYFKVYGIYKNLTPAYDKLCLQMFGGTLTIDEYRTLTSNSEKSYSIEFPPCNTIIPMLEEIYKKTNLNNNFIPIDKNRVQMANTELKLKRSKPIINHKNTLDFCLGGKL